MRGVADFETTTNPEDCRVWGFGLVPLSPTAVFDDVVFGRNIEEFLKYLEHFNFDVIYFHNLAFDGEFIVSHLLNNGYKHTNDKLKPKTFSTLISRDRKWYRMFLKTESGHTVDFRDSLKKLPLSVDKVAKAFDLPISKLTIDYNEERQPGHILTVDEKAYIANDVLIMARALALVEGEGGVSLTIGADSLNEYRSMSPGFNVVFPTLDEVEDALVRKAYRGGWVYTNPKWQREVVGPGKVFDVNSLYPSVMYDRLLPFGRPKIFDSAPPHQELWIASATVTAKLKDNHLPCIQIKNHSFFNDREYVTEIADPEELVFSSVDYELWCSHYDFEVLSWNGGYSFDSASGLFTDYIDKFMEIKESATGGKRFLAKLHLNSLYGKFGTNPDVTRREPYLEDGVLKLRMGVEETREPVYTPMAVFITAYARAVTITAAQKCYDSFLYADTDSIHVLGDTPPIDTHPSKLGCWKHEYDFDYAMFWRAKAYIEREPSGVYHTHIAGLPVHLSSEVRICDFVNGKTFGGKLMPKHVKGGVVLVETEYQLKV